MPSLIRIDRFVFKLKKKANIIIIIVLASAALLH